MSQLRITLACGDYDRTRPLLDGRVQPEGIDLNCIPLRPEEIFWRMLRDQEFEASEMSMSSYLMARERGTPRLVAVPVFISRMFRHSCIYINTRSGIHGPADLIGKRVGVPEYQITMALWVRGMLEHEYGVSPRQIHWFTGGGEQPGREEKLPLDLPGVQISTIPRERTLADMLEGGEIDALVIAYMPSVFLRGTSHIRRLFPDYRGVEQEYFRRTRLFPIMHTIVLRGDVYEQNPWAAQSLYKAFCQAMRLCQTQLYDTNVLVATLPWLIAEIEDTRKLFGDDFWPYGIEPNRLTLETLTQYSYEQGLTGRKLEVDALFAPNTLKEFKI